ncbi:MAG: autotransporter-associated beta strand repeat-containing protein [Marinilabiliaceae bacterium]|nr:autotransporter-associated beta strand repeat-containing protein [Marinilabiliaceae bacterium]
MRKIFYPLILALSLGFSAHAQRQMETLDRGVVAVKVPAGVFVSWRIPGDEWYGVTYNLYRDGVKVNASPLEVSNYLDASGTGTSSYSVKAVVNNVEQVASIAVTPWAQQYKEITLKPRSSAYQINDITTADLDGDGEYELIVKRLNNDYANTTTTEFSFFEAYKLDGTHLWSIDVGPNLMDGVEINIMAFDFNGDGKAEVVMRSSEGTVDGKGNAIGDTNGDGKTNYRSTGIRINNSPYMIEGPEFLSLYDGVTGEELDRVDFIARAPLSQWGPSGLNEAQLAHRCSKYFFGAPYLDGVKPSIFIGRGIYYRTKFQTYDVVDNGGQLELQARWSFDSGTGEYCGQGNHNYAVADIDMDGRDEIVWGSMVVDDDGKGKYSTRFGHGDALHVGDLDPYRKGTEVFKCIEDSPNWGTSMWDGATGEIIIHHYTGYDCGRCCAANISDDIKGKELWGGNKLFSASTREQVANGANAENFRIYWDGDLLEEMTDHTGFSSATGYGTGCIYKYGLGSPLFTATGATSCNYTKGTPSLQADLLGDWREEVVWRKEDNSAVRIYTTVDPTIYRNYTLMHDHQYRQAVAWQMCGYNQPPHVSYFLGEAEGLTVPPPPVMTNNRLVFAGSNSWDVSNAVWKYNGAAASYSDASHVLLDVSAGSDVALSLTSTVAPSVLTVNSPGNYAIDASSGKFSGAMQLVKQGEGVLTLNGVHDYSGTTAVWGGRLNFSGELQQSAVWLGFFSQMDAVGKLAKGALLRYGSKMYVGGENANAALEVGESLTLEENAALVFDLVAPADAANDLLSVSGNLTLNDHCVIYINGSGLVAGNYALINVAGEFTGDLTKVAISGIDGVPCHLENISGVLTLVVEPVRAARDITWTGTVNSEWDLANLQNFNNGTSADYFATGDHVTFDASSLLKIVSVSEQVMPASVTVTGSADYTIEGVGKISGSATLTKSGSGTLVINNDNDFTGKVLINEGVLEVSKMPTSQDVGAIGKNSSVPANFEINGGTLRVLGDGYAQRAMFIGANGGSIENTGKLYWFEPVTGGILTKTGAGQLIFGGVNTNTKTVVKEGSVYLLMDAANPGKMVSLEDATLYFFNDIYSTNTWTSNIEVPDGKIGNVYFDGRSTNLGALTGAGTLNAYIPFVRNYFNGNWSAFSGAINLINNTNSGVDFIVNNTYGYANASVNIGANVYAYHESGSAVKFGALTGTGVLSGAHNWELGAKNTDFTFDGTIGVATKPGASVKKVGTGTMTLTAANIYTGTTIVSAGELEVTNTSGSATGTGAVTVKSGAALSGKGILISAVTVENGGTLYAGYATTTGSSLQVARASLNATSRYHVKVNAKFGVSDKLICSESFVANGVLVMDNTNTASGFVAGKSFTIVSAPTITGSFASVSPETPGAGLAWDFSEFNTAGKVKVVAATGILNRGVEQLTFYPNPTNGIVNVQMPSGVQKAFVTVSAMNGREVMVLDAADGFDLELDLTPFEKGIYTIRLVADDHIYVGKVILK